MYPVWILLCFPSAVRTENCSELQKEAIIGHQIHQELSTINCHYNRNESQQLVVSLETKHILCKYKYDKLSWSKQICNDNIKFQWTPQTGEISFQLLNLQFNNSAIYKCTVENYLPPPTRCLAQKSIFIDVQASPSVSVSCEKGPGGSLTMLCTSKGFYPYELKQAWLRSEKPNSYQNSSVVLNSSDIRWKQIHNTDGTWSITSSLPLSSGLGVYYCWVNHSALSQPIIVNITSTECTEIKERLTVLVTLVSGISCGVIAGIGLILAGCYKCSRKRNSSRSEVEAAPLPEPVSHRTLGSLGNHQPVPEVYSTLADYQPVPEVYSTLGDYQPVPEVYSTLGDYQPVPEVYSTLGSHQPVPCRNNSNGSPSLSL
ncbi:uncharacterized protein LOC124393611 isoform X2 [Silurus meridionalis]|nr:uncharacterized protein LOC124393611 isoform X2 [Silurus meridionalis]